ncbi:MAG: hypothetical protein JRF42_02255, partial [Deltaproteobacteria bacterium]|nr:hypothetical protein [Deltaproteobacteria bacterium]
MNVNVTKLELKTSLLLFSSPKATAVTADVTSFEMGDTVTFDVKLNPTTVDYLSLATGNAYNVDDIIIYRKIDLGGGAIDVQEVARTTAIPLQTDFTLTAIATEAGDVANNFFAFVETTALSVPF